MKYGLLRVATLFPILFPLPPKCIFFIMEDVKGAKAKEGSGCLLLNPPGETTEQGGGWLSLLVWCGMSRVESVGLGI